MTKVSFYEQYLEDADFARICSELPSDVTDLDLRDNAFTTLAPLISILPNLTSLKKLRLSQNELNGKEVAQVIKAAPVLEELECVSCELSESTSKSISNAIKKNTTLKFIDLSENRLGDGFAEHLQQALRTNTTVMRIVLQNCEISSNGRQLLGEQLSIMRVLI
ncbi:hypothetical protein RCL1_004333 [Eukaryota sp. TZLM3-RCL]